jgi:hypothetical protein
MSPRVQLMTYPSSDSGFAEHTARHVSTETPAATGDDVVDAAQERLRAQYPNAAIRVDEATEPGYDATWHVYRDGLPAQVSRRSEADSSGGQGDDPPGFGWREPRWRDSDDEQGSDAERDRRFRNAPAPRHRGALDGRSLDDDGEVDRG